MKTRYIPYMFLLALVCILIFILGIQYGREVERVNKTISYIISLTPTVSPKQPTPTPQTAFVFTTYEQCGTAFLYPGELTKTEELETAGITRIQYQDTSGNSRLKITCYNPFTVEDTDYSITSIDFFKPSVTAGVDVSSASALMRSNAGTRFKIYKNPKEMIEVKLIHPRSGDYIIMQFTQNLLPLMETTFEVINTPRPTPTRS